MCVMHYTHIFIPSCFLVPPLPTGTLSSPRQMCACVRACVDGLQFIYFAIFFQADYPSTLNLLGSI